MIKNLPTNRGEALRQLIDYRPHQIVSMSLSKSPGIQMTLFSFADEEMISEEEYYGDTMYYVVEGMTEIIFGEQRIPLQEGDVFHVPTRIAHAIGGIAPFKLLQITINL